MKKLLLIPLALFITACPGGSKEVPPPTPPPVPVSDTGTAQASAAAAAPSVPSNTGGGKKFVAKGNITFTGKVPTDVVKMQADQVCATAHKGKTVTQYAIVTGPGNGLANVLVTLREGKSLPGSAAALSPAVLDQKGCIYTPHILPVQVNQPVTIVNSDPTMHNVNAQSKTGQGFNAGMPTAGQKMEKKFSKPEVVRVKCDVHGWMNAYIAVLDHHYYAVTGPDGSFTFSDLPAGKYNAEVWHEKLGTQNIPFEVVDKDVTVSAAFN